MTSGWLGLDWGNVPTWIGTVVTSTSLAVAAASYRRSVRDKERDQASQVAAWIGVSDDGKSRVVRLVNGSDSSVYELRMNIDGVGEKSVLELPGRSISAVPAGPVNSQRVSRTEIKVQVLLFEASAEREEILDEPPPEIQFRDAMGRSWIRRTNGRLKRTAGRQVFNRTRTRIETPFGISISRERD